MEIRDHGMSDDLIELLKTATQGHSFWESYLTDLSPKKSLSFSIHLAVLVEPYLHYILQGRKTVESRFSSRRIPPFNSVDKGDVLLLKRSSGPIVGMCLVQSCWFYRINAQTWREMRQCFSEALCAQDPSFWEARMHASYATLMRIARVLEISPIEFPKKDRRGWVVLRPRIGQVEMDL